LGENMVNIKMVAEKAGVSASTVSRVLGSKQAYIAKETREKVLKAVQELQYTPNIYAKGLRGGRTESIALLIPDIENEMFPPIIKGIETYARKNGYNLILSCTNEDIEIEKNFINKMRQNAVDGFIVCSMTQKSDHVRQLQRDGFPLVLVARYYGDKINAVVINNYQAGYDATNYLINSGNRRIAIVVGSIDLSLYRERYEGYKAALQNAGIAYDDRLVIHETSGANGLYKAIMNILKMKDRPDAIFATNDHKAIISMQAVNDTGLRIPDEISVLGFDNIKVSKLLNPALSTVSQPFYDMGSLAAKKLINIINGNGPAEPVVDVFDTEIIIRKTTK
jgi:LacI family transcriptional regulator